MGGAGFGGMKPGQPLSPNLCYRPRCLLLSDENYSTFVSPVIPVQNSVEGLKKGGLGRGAEVCYCPGRPGVWPGGVG